VYFVLEKHRKNDAFDSIKDAKRRDFIRSQFVLNGSQVFRLCQHFFIFFIPSSF
jgi:hypothetical protein